MGFWKGITDALLRLAGDTTVSPPLSSTPVTQISLDIPVAMIGARSVGKTSMLTAIWSQFEAVFGDTDVQCIPDDHSRRILVGKLRELQRLASGQPGLCDTSAGITPTTDVAKYKLRLHHVPTRAEVGMTFTDYPGGWLTSTTVETKRASQINEALRRARILLMPVDTPALMELPQYDDVWNDPENIDYAIKDALASNNDDTLIIFTPTKGERWLHDGTSSQVFERFQERFRRVHGTVSAYARQSPKKVVTLFCPIQTLGSVRFVRYDDQGRPLFERVAGQSYQPRDCDQPLKLALMFVLRDLQRYVDANKEKAEARLGERRTLERGRDTILNFFGFSSAKQQDFERCMLQSRALLASIGRYADSFKAQAGFRVLTGGDVLGLKEKGIWSAN